MERWSQLKFFKGDGHERVMKKIQYAPFYPFPENIYRALILTPYDKVRVVILGQDPYPGWDKDFSIPHACGVAFSVDSRVIHLPWSLRNIMQELQNDTLQPYPVNGDLTPWTKEGVLLLNTCLTVEPGKPLSHKDAGWEELTLEIVRSLNDCVWILWGRNAQEYKSEIRNPRGIIESAHPSPWSANKGFFGSGPFNRVNRILDRPVDWTLPWSSSNALVDSSDNSGSGVGGRILHAKGGS